MIICVTDLQEGQTGVVKEIKGGCGIITKLQSIGIRIDKKIKKVSGQSFRGPQILKIYNLQLAIGFGMAKHILVEVKDK